MSRKQWDLFIYCSADLDIMMYTTAD